MAHNDTEIEIKILISSEDFSRLKIELPNRAKLVKSVKQVDRYYTPVHRNFVGHERPFEWLSIRERGDKVILNYKHFYPEGAEINTHCDEYETEIENKEQLEKILKVLDFQELATVEKIRDVCVYGDEFEIALDEVKDLGYFIEIEALKDLGSVEETREKLFAFAKDLGVDISKTDKRGYPYLLMKKEGLLNQ